MSHFDILRARDDDIKLSINKNGDNAAILLDNNLETVALLRFTIYNSEEV